MNDHQSQVDVNLFGMCPNYCMIVKNAEVDSTNSI